jgi:hypothetical protein
LKQGPLVHPTILCSGNSICQIILAQFFNKFADIIMKDGIIFGHKGIQLLKKDKHGSWGSTGASVENHTDANLIQDGKICR